MDPTNHESKATMVERLDALHQARAADRELRDAARREAADPRENIATAMSEYAREKNRMERDVKRIIEIGPLQASDTKQVEETKAAMDRLASDITLLEATCSQAAYFLPAYEQRSMAGGISLLRNELDEARVAVLPRKKFTFTRRTKRGGERQQETSDKTPLLLAAALPTTPSTPAPTPLPTTTHASSSAASSTSTATLSNRSNETITLLPHELAGRDFTLSDLSNCTILLLGSLTALRLHRMDKCRVLCGPIRGSCFLENVSECTIHLASYQVRVHHTFDTTLCMRVKSRPIIEHCDKIYVAPYSVTAPHQGQEEWAGMMKTARLEHETGLWKSVDDFGWIRAVASPHWAALPESEWPRMEIPTGLLGSSKGLTDKGPAVPLAAASASPLAPAPPATTSTAAVAVTTIHDDDDEI